MTTPDPGLREATPAEMRALGHPLRWRILRLTLERPMTNKEIAQRLDRDPGTVLHHVRGLVRTGFLEAEPVRSGKRGALERPYRSTGKSWQIRMSTTPGTTAAVLDAVREELMEAGEDAPLAMLRLGVRLRAADIDALRAEISDLGDRYVARQDPDGEPVGIFGLVHRRKA